MNTAPLGLMVIVGQLGCPFPPHTMNWLTLIVTVAAGLPGVSTPDAVDTLTAPSGSPLTVTDQLTTQLVPSPAARREIWVPAPPGAT